MIRATLSNALHGVGHGFEWASKQSHEAADKVLTWPKWMDLKTDEAVQAIREWGQRQEASYQARMESQQFSSTSTPPPSPKAV